METKQDEYWGYHLMVSATGLNKYLVREQDHIKEFFSSVVDGIKMNPMMEPMTKYCSTGDPKKSGVTAFIIIETSNLCAHFLDDDNNGSGGVMFDVFSCLEFDKDIPIKMLEEWFSREGDNFKLTDVQFIKRRLN